jgi:hypothetical protein
MDKKVKKRDFMGSIQNSQRCLPSVKRREDSLLYAQIEQSLQQRDVKMTIQESAGDPNDLMFATEIDVGNHQP